MVGIARCGLMVKVGPAIPLDGAPVKSDDWKPGIPSDWQVISWLIRKQFTRRSAPRHFYSLDKSGRKKLCPSRSIDRMPVRLHSLRKDRLRELVRAAEDERTEILVPVARWCTRSCLHSLLKRQPVNYGDAALVDSLQKVLPKRSEEVSELNLRQSRRPRKSTGSEHVSSTSHAVVFGMCADPEPQESVGHLDRKSTVM